MSRQYEGFTALGESSESAGPRTAFTAPDADEAELSMSIGYVLDTSAPETIAGCWERIRQMQIIIKRLDTIIRASDSWWAVS